MNGSLKTRYTADELKQFLLNAKREGYAGSDDEESVPNPLLYGSKQLEWNKGPWEYRDIYFGMERFTGLETVSLNGVPVWALCYAGGTTRQMSEEEYLNLYVFLRKALLRLPEKLPLRGPKRYESKGYRYAMHYKGGLDRFEGYETITFTGLVLYQLNFTGGQIS